MANYDKMNQCKFMTIVADAGSAGEKLREWVSTLPNTHELINYEYSVAVVNGKPIEYVLVRYKIN